MRGISYKPGVGGESGGFVPRPDGERAGDAPPEVVAPRREVVGDVAGAAQVFPPKRRRATRKRAKMGPPSGTGARAAEVRAALGIPEAAPEPEPVVRAVPPVPAMTAAAGNKTPARVAWLMLYDPTQFAKENFPDRIVQGEAVQAALAAYRRGEVL